MKPFRFIGMTGLAITIFVNLVALFVFKRHSAEFFSPQWLSVWFTNYVVWFTFTVIGFASRRPN